MSLSFLCRRATTDPPLNTLTCNKCRAVQLKPDDFSKLRGGPDTTSEDTPGVGLLAGSTFQDWRRVPCPSCGKHHATRDTDTLDTFVDSSWYYLRYCGGDGVNNGVDMEGLPQDQPFSAAALQQWMPVDVYIGGIEHAILHLLYARFIGHVVHGNGVANAETVSPLIGSAPTAEPFRELLAQGMVCGRTHKDPETGRYLMPDEVELDSNGKGIMRQSGTPTMEVWEKMSKSKYNGIDPKDVVADYGADATRLAMLFKAPVVSDVLLFLYFCCFRFRFDCRE